MIGVSFIPEVTLGGVLGGAGHQKDQAMIRSLELSAPPFSVQGGVNNWSRLCEEAYIHILKAQGKGASESVNTWRCWEGAVPRQGIQALSLFTYTLLYASLPFGCLSVSFLISFYSK